MKPLIVAITGASGVVYGLRLVQVLADLGNPVELIISETGRLVIKEETNHVFKNYTDPAEIKEALGIPASSLLTLHSPKNFSASIASGSYPTAGMVIIPCSMGTLGAVASGISQNLIHRAADCTLKEGRRFVIVPRETPLHSGHLENMLRLSRMGAKMVPAMPGFYSGAKSIEELVDFMVGKVLDQFEITHALYPRWTGMLGTLRGV